MPALLPLPLPFLSPDSASKLPLELRGPPCADPPCGYSYPFNAPPLPISFKSHGSIHNLSHEIGRWKKRLLEHSPTKQPVRNRIANLPMKEFPRTIIQKPRSDGPKTGAWAAPRNTRAPKKYTHTHTRSLFSRDVLSSGAPKL